MTLDPQCSVLISNINEDECMSTSTPSASASNSVESINSGESTPISDAIIGGVVAVVIVLIIAITVAVVTIVFLQRNRQRGVSMKKSAK